MTNTLSIATCFSGIHICSKTYQTPKSENLYKGEMGGESENESSIRDKGRKLRQQEKDLTPNKITYRAEEYDYLTNGFQMKKKKASRMSFFHISTSMV